MSVAEAPVTQHPSVHLRRANTRFFRSELALIFGRRRNWFGGLVLVSVPILIAVVIKVTSAEADGGGPDFFGAITDNGLFVALSSLIVELPFFLPIAVSAIAGDAIAGEANTGTLRYLLAVPVSRTRMLMVKYAGIVVFTFAAVALIAIVGALIGLALFGPGSAASLSGTSLTFADSACRIAAIALYISIQLCALGAIGLFVSTLTEQPIGATISLLILTILSQILGQIPQIDWLHPYLFTYYWTGFMDLMRDPMYLDGAVRDGLLSAGAYTAIFLSAAWAHFSGRDITS